MTVYKRNGIFHYDFKLNGQRYHGTTKERQRGRALSVEADVRARAVNDRLPPGMKKIPTLADYGKRFLLDLAEQAKAGHKAKNTLRDYNYGASLLEGTKLWGMKLDQIDSGAVEKIAFPSWAMGNSALRTLRRILHAAEDARLIYRAPKIKLFEDRQRTTVIEPWLEEIMLAEAREPLRTAMIIMLDSFMRPSEVVAIKWEDISWEQGRVRIPKSKTPQGKRHVGLTSRMKSALASLSGRKDSKDWVFPAKRLVCGVRNAGAVTRTCSSHMLPTSFGKMWKPMKEAVLKKVHETNPEWQWPRDLVLYSCRHTGITEYSEQVGGNPWKVAKAAGHADLKTTSRYNHPQQDQGAVMDKVVEFRRKKA